MDEGVPHWNRQHAGVADMVARRGEKCRDFRNRALSLAEVTWSGEGHRGRMRERRPCRTTVRADFAAAVGI